MPDNQINVDININPKRPKTDPTAISGYKGYLTKQCHLINESILSFFFITEAVK
jgi:hypothetical protein